MKKVYCLFFTLHCLLFTLLLSNCGKKQSGHNSTEIHEKDSQQKKVLYHCPMHPTYISDKPGDCPICGMKLVPIENKAPVEKEKGTKTSELSGLATVTISPEKQQLIGIKTEIVKYRHLTKIIRAVGKIAHDPELYNAQKEYLEAVRTNEKVKNSPIPEVIERAESLMKSSYLRLVLLGLSDEQIKELETQKDVSTKLLVGTLNKTVWMYAQIYEYEIGMLKIGQTVKAYSKAFPDRTFSGIIRSIDPVLDPETRTVRIRAELDNPEGLVRHEMFVNTEINISLGNVLAVPKEAVLDSGTRQIAFVDKGNGIFQPRKIKIKWETDDYYELISGVRAGEKVVTSANFLIDSESKLKSAIGEMTGEHKH